MGRNVAKEGGGTCKLRIYFQPQMPTWEATRVHIGAQHTTQLHKYISLSSCSVAAAAAAEKRLENDSHWAPFLPLVYCALQWVTPEPDSERLNCRTILHMYEAWNVLSYTH